MVGPPRCSSSSSSRTSSGTRGLVSLINLVLLSVATVSSLADQSVTPQDGNDLSNAGLVLQTTEDPQTTVPVFQWGSSSVDPFKDATIGGSLYLYDWSSSIVLKADSVPYIDCDDNNATQAYQKIVGSRGGDIPFVIIFYTTNHEYCKWENKDTEALNILTTLDYREASSLRDLLVQKGESGLPVKISYNRSDATPSPNPDYSNQNALGPAPSTSVALIILYSITGVITALFLLIIITGAIRAHRHPDRYGPRATARFGRPRQSRAKGLARAVLDTLPIVRFRGAREEPAKPEVELREQGAQASDTEEEERTLGQVPVASDTPMAGGIQAAPPSITPAPAGDEGKGASDEGGLQPEQMQCPVCIEDFEEGQDLRVLPCGHIFHPDCIDPWLLNVAGSCPLCRIDLRPEEQTLEVPAPAATPDSSTRHSRGSRFFGYLERARQGTTEEERMEALRQLRDESRGADGAGARTPDLGLSRLRRALNKRLSSGRVTPAVEEDPGGSSSSSTPAGEASSSDTNDGAQR